MRPAEDTRIRNSRAWIDWHKSSRIKISKDYTSHGTSHRAHASPFTFDLSTAVYNTHEHGPFLSEAKQPSYRSIMIDHTKTRMARISISREQLPKEWFCLIDDLCPSHTCRRRDRHVTIHKHRIPVQCPRRDRKSVV